MGTAAFAEYKKYPVKLKLQVFHDYLSGLGFQDDIWKYKIRSNSRLQIWIKMYNSHKQLPSSGKWGEVIMTKERKTTFKERIEIVQLIQTC